MFLPVPSESAAALNPTPAQHTARTAGLVVAGMSGILSIRGFGEHAFTAHMVLHMALVAIAAPLLALGVAGTAMDPVRRFPQLFPAIPVSAVEFVAVWAWHVPGLHHLTQHSNTALALEQLIFLFTGVWLWLAAFGGDPLRRMERGAAGVIGLLLTSMHMTLLGALIALTPRPLYEAGHSSDRLSALADQQLGGVLMLLIGGISYLAGALCLTREILRGSAAPVRPGPPQSASTRETL